MLARKMAHMKQENFKALLTTVQDKSRDFFDSFLIFFCFVLCYTCITNNEEVTIMVAVRLPREMEDRLAKLAEKTGRSKSFYIRQALEEHLEEMEDIYLAEERFRTLAKTVPLDELMNELEMAR